MKKWLSFILLGLSISATAQHYVRGAFNGFGTSNPLTLKSDVGNDMYGATIAAAPTGDFLIANNIYSDKWGGLTMTYLSANSTFYNNLSWQSGANASFGNPVANYLHISAHKPAAHTNSILPVVGHLLAEPPVTIDDISGPAALTTAAPQVVLITISDPLGAGENLMLRYFLNNDFSNDFVVAASCTSVNCVATIPAQTLGTKVDYYAITSVVNAATVQNAVYNFSGTNIGPDLLTINAFPLATYNVSLPVELTHFNARKAEKASILDWATASETNSDRFAVERSGDQNDWREIGSVSGKGTSHAPQTYRFEDRQPLAGLNCYRLRQIDLDGKWENSPVRSLDFRTKKAAIVQPNPAQDFVQIDFETEADESGKIQISDAAGRLVFERTADLQKGANSLILNDLAIPDGLFFVQIFGEKSRLGDPVRLVVRR